MHGRIVQVSISAGGLPKRAVLSAFAGRLGLTGDAHAHPSIHGGPAKAILLIAVEVIDDLAERGFPVFPGALGENLTTEGIDFWALRLGARLRAGAALLEITTPRGPCSQLDVYGPSIKSEIYDERVRLRDPESQHWGVSGFYASVLEDGEITPGCAVELLRESV
jgi:MOSC domain-containing protein YiiM